MQIQDGGVGTVGPHVEGAKRPDLSVLDVSRTDPAEEARRAELPSERAPRGGRKSAAVLPISQPTEYPTPEVAEKAARRQFTAAYKLRILQEVEARREDGAVGRLLRREGLFSSHLTKWRKQKASGALAGLAPKKRGPKAEAKNPLAGKVAALERDKKRLEARLRRTELLLDIQKKIADLLGISLTAPENEGEL